MQSVKGQVKCPTCGEFAVWSTRNPYRPFCSERCKNIDLGAWSTGQYGIAADHSEESSDSPESE